MSPSIRNLDSTIINCRLVWYESKITHNDPSKSIVISRDANSYGAGGVMNQ